MTTLKNIREDATLKKSQVAPCKNLVDFTGYPSNHFSGCRLNGLKDGDNGGKDGSKSQKKLVTTFLENKNAALEMISSHF